MILTTPVWLVQGIVSAGTWDNSAPVTLPILTQRAKDSERVALTQGSRDSVFCGGQRLGGMLPVSEEEGPQENSPREKRCANPAWKQR